MRDSVTMYVDAPPAEVWQLVADVTNIGRYSPETFEAEWLGDATGPAVGARFRGHVRRNERGPTYWTHCEVVACQPGREFAFAVRGTKGRTFNTWRYTFAPSGNGTEVTESFHLSDLPILRVYWALVGWARRRTNVEGMRTTLTRIKAVAEGDRPA